MKNKITLPFALMSLANYALILFSVLCYWMSGGLFIICNGFIFGLAFANARVARRTYQFIILSIHLLISALIAMPLGGLLYYYRIGDLYETLWIIQICVVINGLGAIGFSILAFCLNKKRFQADTTEKVHNAKSIWIITGAIWSIVAVALVLMIMPRELHITDTHSAILTYRSDGVVITEALSEEDAAKIAEMYDGKDLSLYTKSHAFRDDIAVSFGDQKLKIATDGSGTIQYHGKFIDLSGTQRVSLRNILFRYGAKQPY